MQTEINATQGLKYMVSILFFCFHLQENTLYAQQSSFHNLSDKLQQEQIAQWMNQSAFISMDAVWAETLSDYYKQLNIQENAAKKNAMLYQPIFNNKISALHRIDYCTYLLQHFSEEEICFAFIHKQLSLLRNQKIKE